MVGENIWEVFLAVPTVVGENILEVFLIWGATGHGCSAEGTDAAPRAHGTGALQASEYERSSRRRYLTFVATALSNVRRDDGFSDFWIFGFSDFRIFGFLDFWIFGFSDFWIFGFLDFRIFGFLDFARKSTKISRKWKNSTTEAE